MYNNPNDWRAAGYFCCDSDLRGYNATGKEGSDGCARVENGTLGKDDKLLNVEGKGRHRRYHPSPTLQGISIGIALSVVAPNMAALTFSWHSTGKGDPKRL